MRYPRMSAGQVANVLAESSELAFFDPAVRYPRWYLVRQHFLPRGYLSRRSAALYEHLVPRIYNAGFEGRILRSLARRIAESGPVQSVLQFGCGPGHLLAHLARTLPGARLTGVDLSPFLLERAARTLARAGAEATLVHGDLANGPALPAADAVVAVHLLGHVPLGVAASITRRAAASVAPGGSLHVVDHSWHRHLLMPEGIEESAEERLVFGALVYRRYRRDTLRDRGRYDNAKSDQEPLP